MEFNGLPLHPLAVHGAVVLAPLAALAALAYAVPRWRDVLRWPMLVAALVAGGAVVLAYLSGDSFREANAFFSSPGELADKIDTHAEYGETLLWVTLGFAVVAVLNAVFHKVETAWVRFGLAGLLAIDAVAVLVLVFLTGEAGARAVWDGIPG